jgi:hypothetical protein
VSESPSRIAIRGALRALMPTALVVDAGAAGRAVRYRTLFPALIQDWRSNWGYEFPFLFVPLAGYGPDTPEAADSAWAELREARAGTFGGTAYGYGCRHRCGRCRRYSFQ